MSDTITLFCLVHGDDPTGRAFLVNVSVSDTISNLKELVKAKMTPWVDDIPAYTLDLWRVNIPQGDLSTLDPMADVQTLGVKLSPLSKIFKTFPDGVEDEHIHVIVVK